MIYNTLKSLLILSLFSVILILGISQAHAEVTITPTSYLGAPGCEKTAKGCYHPNIATVDVGGKVVMKNTDTVAHTFTSGTPDGGPDGVFDTSLLMIDGSYEWTPDTVGEYPYFCMVHPWMTGSIVVRDGGNYDDRPKPSPPKHDDDQLKVENQKLKEQIRDLKFENKQLKNRIDSLNSEIDSLKEQIVSMTGEFVKMITQLNEWFRSQLG